MPSIEKEPIYDVYCISRRQHQRFLNFLFWGVSVAQLVVSMSGVVLGGVVMVVGSNLAGGKIFTHLSAQLIHYIPLYLYILSNLIIVACLNLTKPSDWSLTCL